MRHGPSIPAILLLAVWTGSAAAQTQFPPQTIQVSAQAVVMARPDLAVIEIGVATQAPTAEAAAVENARRTEVTMRDLRKALGNAGQLKTLGYSVRPLYRYPKEGGAPTISGYSATNTLQITTPDLAAAGRLIDTATAAGANTIQQLQFKLKDDQEAQLQALREAASRASEKAHAMAEALGLKVLRVLSAEESGGVVEPPGPPRIMAMEARAAVPQTPVEAGTIEVRATVTMTVEVGKN